MTIALSSNGGLAYPPVLNGMHLISQNTGTWPGQTMQSLNSTNGRGGWLGHLAHEDGPGSTGVLSAAGGGKIWFRCAATTWSSAGSTFKIGLQNWSAVSTVTPPRPDGTYTVSGTLVQGTDALAAGPASVTMNSGTSGTLTHGDRIAIVSQMTVINGTDAVFEHMNTSSTGIHSAFAVSSTDAGSTWSLAATSPVALIQFDDGKYGWLMGTLPHGNAGTQALYAVNNPDEITSILTVPWDCSIDGIWAMVNFGGANSDIRLRLYSDPLGTPTVMGSGAYSYARRWEDAVTTNYRLWHQPLGGVVNLTAGTKYGVAIAGTDASGCAMPYITPFNSVVKPYMTPDGGTWSGGSRVDDTGAFTEDSTKLWLTGFTIRSIAATAGGGGNAGRRSRVGI